MGFLPWMAIAFFGLLLGVPITLGLASGVSVGADVGAPVIETYDPPFAFTGTLDRVVYDVSGEHIVDHESEIRIALARQ